MDSSLPKELIFSLGAHEKIADLISKYGKRVYILRAGDSFKNSSWAKRIVESIKKSELNFLISKPITSEPDLSIAKEILKEARDFKADVICGIGGGSVMDLAKVVAVLFNESFNDISDYLYSKAIKAERIGLILMPTTSGSGSEVSSSAVLKDNIRKEKRGIRDRRFKADATVVDPIITLTLNRDNTLYPSLDALTHAIEAYVSIDSNIASAISAKRAAYLIYNNLNKVLLDPNNIELRKSLSLASLLAGISFSWTGLGLAHALSHPIGAIYDLPHGLVNAIIIPYVVEFNYSLVRERYEDLIFDKRYNSLYNLLKSWFRTLGLPSSFKELNLNLDGSLKEKIVTSTLNSGVLKYNPKHVKREDVYYILDRLWEK